MDTPEKEMSAAEAEVDRFRRNLGPYVVAVETTRMPMLFTAATPEHPMLFVNESFLKLTGYTSRELIGQSFPHFFASHADPAALAAIEKAFDARSKDDSSNQCAIFFYRKHGDDFWAEFLVAPVVNEKGETVQYFASLADLTQHNAALEHKRLLIDELSHRVKNTLATVQSIVSQVMRNSNDPQVIRTGIETRLAALSRSHDQLTREKWETVEIGLFISETLDPFCSNGSELKRFTLSGPVIRIPPKVVLPLGIAFNELATNSVKFGALANDIGTVSVTWEIIGDALDRRLIIVWRESGGPLVREPTRKGFGSRVLERGLGHELEGTVKIEYLETGVICTIDIPAPRG